MELTPGSAAATAWSRCQRCGQYIKQTSGRWLDIAGLACPVGGDHEEPKEVDE